MAATGFFHSVFSFLGIHSSATVTPSIPTTRRGDARKVTYDFEMSPGARWRHNVPIFNNLTEEVIVKGLLFESNADITNPGPLLEPYWKNVHKTKDETRNVYIYSLLLDPPLRLPPGSKKQLLQYDVGETIGPWNKVALPPQKIAISADGTQYEEIQWAAAPPEPGPHPQKEFMVYQANWSQYRPHQRTVANVQWSDITGLTYSFFGFDESGKVFSLDPWGDQLEVPELVKQVATRRENNPDLKVTLAFGGWTNAGKRMDTVFSAMAADPNTRKKFVEGAVCAAKLAGFDGIDIDWEYPETAKDAENYVLLMQELRRELTEKIGTQAQLTLAAPGGYDKVKVLSKEQWQAIAKNVDRIKVMGYDYFGVWDKYADFHAPWELDAASPHKRDDKVLEEYSIAKTLALYEQYGVTKDKLSVGMPNYARAVIVKDPGDRGGLYQEVVGAPPGELNEAGFYSWDAILSVLNKQASALDSLGVKEWFFYDADHPYCKKAGMCLLSGCLPDGRWVVLTFLDQRSATQRAQMIKEKAYGGTMLWANYCEPAKPTETITRAIAKGLYAPQKELEQQVALPKAVSKEEAQKHTGIGQRLQDYAAKISGFFGSKKKATILEEIKNLESSHLITRHLNSRGGSLQIHRNPFKRLLSAIFDPLCKKLFNQPLFTPPKSYRLATEYYQTKRFFEVENPPARIIADKNSPDISIAREETYREIVSRITSSGSSSQLLKEQEASSSTLPVYYGSIINSQSRDNYPSAPPADMENRPGERLAI